MRRLVAFAILFVASGARAEDVTITTRACENGDASACASLGSLYENGEAGLAVDYVRAQRLYDRACRGGAAFGCASVGRFAERDGDYQRAATMYERACHDGYSYACGYVARFYAEGRGVTKDAHVAAALHESACNAGLGESCASLADLVRTSDLAKAAQLDEKACQLKQMSSCAQLANDYQHARGVPRDERRAEQLNRQACIAGDTVGCANLPPRELAPLRESACMRDSWNACADLARQYATGNGVAQDVTRAVFFYERACAQKHAMSCAWLAEIDREHHETRRADEHDRLACAAGYRPSCHK